MVGPVVVRGDHGAGAGWVVPHDGTVPVLAAQPTDL